MNHIDLQSEWPSVSIIIPFYNNQEQVLRIEEHLRNQTYPASSIEIIFVDNGSDNSFQFREVFLKRNILLTEKNYLNSPYSARNRGIEASKGIQYRKITGSSKESAAWKKPDVI